MAHVNMTDLSIVICGDIRSETKTCILACQRLFPAAQIIIATWQGSDLSFLDDQTLDIIYEKDPGQIDEFGGKTINLLRATTLFHAASLKATGRHIIKIRSDFIPTKMLAWHLAHDQNLQKDTASGMIYVDNVGSSCEPFYISDFVYYGRNDVIRRFALLAFETLSDQNKRAGIRDALLPFHRRYAVKMDYNLAPAEAIGWLSGRGVFQKIPSGAKLSDLFDTHLECRKLQVGYLKYRCFVRPSRLNPFGSPQSFVRFLRAYIAPHSMVGRILNAYYIKRKKSSR